MKNTFPRILVSSVDVWNETSGSDTFTNLLSGYDNEKVANIYIRSGQPTSSVCDRYFFVSENAVIKSIFKRNLKTGIRVKRELNQNIDLDIEQEYQTEKRRYSFFSKHRFWIFIYIREILWKIGKWQTPELDSFVEDFNPEVLFFPIESYIHFNRMNQYLVKKTGVPAVGIIWDDNFSYKAHHGNLGFVIHRYFLRKSVKKSISCCSKIFAISPRMQKELKDVFGVDAELLTKGAKIEEENLPKDTMPKAPLKMVYTGKLNYGRLGTVLKVAEVLDEINKEGMQIELDIYSGTKLDEKEKKQLEKTGTIFKGHVTQDKVRDIQNAADILLMAEALEGKHKYDARLSFSTKIVDYMAKGKCILSVGPQDIAPIEYLKENDAALVASSKELLQEHLKRVLLEPEVLIDYGEKAYELALKNHNQKTINTCLYNAFENVYIEGNEK